MATPLRRTNLAHVLIATACSGATLSTAPSDIEAVSALDPTSDCNPDCHNDNIAGAAVGGGVVWLTRSIDSFPNCPNGSCGGQQHTYTATFDLATFGADGGLQQIATAPGSGTVYLSAAVGVTPDGSQQYVGYIDPTSGAPMVAAGADGGFISLSGASSSPGEIIGIAARPEQMAILGVAPGSNQSTCGGGPCGPGQGDDPAYFGLGGGGPGGVDGGVLLGVNFADGGRSQQPAEFDTGTSIHLFASDSSSVYWIGGSAVWSAPLDLSSTIKLTPITSSVTCNGSTCNVTSPVGLAAAGGMVAWAVIQGSSTCNMGPCTYTPGSCQIFASPTAPFSASLVYQAPGTCLGLAIDPKTNQAYFGVAEQKTVASGTNHDDGGVNYNTNVYTTAVSRISLAGPSGQKAASLQLTNERFYGPRRFFVDDTFVYGIDPAYVLRIDKNSPDFKP